MARIVLVSILLLGGSVAARSRLVVLGIAPSSPALKPIAESINEQVLTDLGREARLDVLGTSDVQAVLGLERQRQLLGCSDSSSCLVEISGALGAPWLVSGSLAKFGRATRVDLKLLRTRDGKVVFRDGQTFKDDSEVFEAVSVLVAKLLKAVDFTEGATPDAPVVDSNAKPIPDEPPPAIASAPSTPAPSNSTGKWVVGGVGLAAVLAGGFVCGLGFANYDSTKARRADLEYSAAQSSYAAANSLKLAGGIIGGAGLAAVGAALVWFLLPSTPTVSIGFGENRLLVWGSF